MSRPDPSCRLTDAEVAAIRAATPGCAGRIHLDSAGASLMPQTVLDAVTGHLALEAAVGGYEAKRRRADELAAVYDACAAVIGAGRDEIALLENATRAWDAAFYALPLQAGDRILTGRAEYVSNSLAFLQLHRSRGVEVQVVEDDEHGQIDVAALRDAIDERTKLIALTHVPTNGGLVNPAAAVGAVAREAGVTYILDACQAAGQLPLDVAELGCDVLSTTGRKFLRGPRGTGFLYVRRELAERLEPPVVDVRSAIWTAPDSYQLAPGMRRFETWEMSYASLLGLGAAAQVALDVGVDRTWAHVHALAADLRTRLESELGAVVRDKGAVRGAIVTFTLDGVDPHGLRERLEQRSIGVSVSEPADSLHDSAVRGLPQMVRASLHHFTTSEEITAFVQAVGELGDDMRRAK
jgi:selenocysteine lyase/cysteine desulfurase